MNSDAPKFPIIVYDAQFCGIAISLPYFYLSCTRYNVSANDSGKTYIHHTKLLKENTMSSSDSVADIAQFIQTM